MEREAFSQLESAMMDATKTKKERNEEKTIKSRK